MLFFFIRIPLVSSLLGAIVRVKRKILLPICGEWCPLSMMNAANKPNAKETFRCLRRTMRVASDPRFSLGSSPYLYTAAVDAMRQFTGRWEFRFNRQPVGEFWFNRRTGRMVLSGPTLSGKVFFGGK